MVHLTYPQNLILVGLGSEITFSQFWRECEWLKRPRRCRDRGSKTGDGAGAEGAAEGSLVRDGSQGHQDNECIYVRCFYG